MVVWAEQLVTGMTEQAKGKKDVVYVHIFHHDNQTKGQRSNNLQKTTKRSTCSKTVYSTKEDGITRATETNHITTKGVQNIQREIYDKNCSTVDQIEYQLF